MQLLLLGLALCLLPIVWAWLARYLVHSAHAGVALRFAELERELAKRRQLLARELPALAGRRASAGPGSGARWPALLAAAEAAAASDDREAWLAAERELGAALAADSAADAPAPSPGAAGAGTALAQQGPALSAAARRYDLEARDFNLRIRSLPGNLIAARSQLRPWPLASFDGGPQGRAGEPARGAARRTQPAR